MLEKIYIRAITILSFIAALCFIAIKNTENDQTSKTYPTPVNTINKNVPNNSFSDVSDISKNNSSENKILNTKNNKVYDAVDYPRGINENTSVEEGVDIHHEGLISREVNSLGLSESQQRELDSWEKERGYDLLEQFGLQREPGDFPVAHPHIFLPLEQLETLALNGDAKAQLFYAMNIRDQVPELAVEYYKEAAINGGYTSAYNLIATTYYNQILVAESIERYKEQSLLASTPDTRISEEKKQELVENAQLWALIGDAHNDIYASKLLEDLGYYEKPQGARQALAMNADRVNAELYLEKHSRGSGDFPTRKLPDDIVKVLTSI